MFKISVLLWMLLTIILISLPIGVASFFFSKKIFRKLYRLLGKIDTFDALVKFKKDVVYFYTTKMSFLRSRLYKNNKSYAATSPKKDFLEKIDNIVKPESYFVAEYDTQEEQPFVSDQESRIHMIKKKKLIEKIIYDALGLRKEGKLDDYEKKIIEGLALDSEDKDLNKLLADLYFTMSNYKKALPILKKIVEMDPKDHKAIWQIGEIYLTSSDFDVAELLIQKAIAINPTNPKYYISMVELMYNTDRKRDAVEEMEKVIKLRPTNSAYMLTLADLYEELGDVENAKKYYFRVLEYEPSNEKAKKKLKELVVE